MKVVLAEVLTRVELRAAPGYTVRTVRRTVTLAPSGGMPVVVLCQARTARSSAPAVSAGAVE